jgi:hypothetical protein
LLFEASAAPTEMVKKAESADNAVRTERWVTDSLPG